MERLNPLIQWRSRHKPFSPTHPLATMNLAAPSCPVANPTSRNVPHWLSEYLDHQCTLAECSSSHSSNDSDLICQAYEFANQLHAGQCRASGEPYIYHPIAVAGLLKDLGGSGVMIAAGLLHDVVEDTEVSGDEIGQRFGREVQQLVEGVTKLSKFNFSSKTEQQAENFRRMFIAMADDIRVIVVKLADRLHNMRTLEHLSADKQVKIALETREIFAPLANRLGIGRFKWELEDLAFKYLETESYRQVQELVAEKRTDREVRLAKVTASLHQRLIQAGIRCVEISSRPKHLYGIYQKMQRQQKEFHEIYDIRAIRIIVENTEECYRALAVVHDAYHPIPGRFKDYIGLPKPNHYQSLHTVVIGHSGRPIEVQIRTLDMHHIAEYGIAAHWKYKETGTSVVVNSPAEEKFSWLRQLLDWQNDLKDAQEYLDSIRDDLFEDDVFVFTPRGDVVSLSRGSTSIDFAYRIHTEVGNHCAGVKINSRMVPLSTPLQNGDIVEIITQKHAHPSLDWLNFTVTGGARNRIRQWYKRSCREENIARGRECLEKELGKNGFEALLKSDPILLVAQRCNYHSVEDLLAGLGYGEVTLNSVVNRIREAVKAKQVLSSPKSTDGEMDHQVLFNAIPFNRLISQDPIMGIEGLVHHIARCCNPIPGEPITGAVTLGNRGISIHRQGCSNVEGVPGDRRIPVSWNPSLITSAVTYPVAIQIEAIDRVGVFKDVLSRLYDHKINVRDAHVKTNPNSPAIIDLCIDIKDCQQLDRIMAQIRKMSDVLTLHRINQNE